jgi:hypothetical protein
VGRTIGIRGTVARADACGDQWLRCEAAWGGGVGTQIGRGRLTPAYRWRKCVRFRAFGAGARPAAVLWANCSRGRVGARHDRALGLWPLALSRAPVPPGMEPTPAWSYLPMDAGQRRRSHFTKTIVSVMRLRDPACRRESGRPKMLCGENSWSSSPSNCEGCRRTPGEGASRRDQGCHSLRNRGTSASGPLQRGRRWLSRRGRPGGGWRTA